MSAVAEILAALQKKGSPARVKTFAKHGAPADRMSGVSVADMKVIAKTIKGQQALTQELTRPGNSDAMYLAGWSPMERS